MFKKAKGQRERWPHAKIKLRGKTSRGTKGYLFFAQMLNFIAGIMNDFTDFLGAVTSYFFS